MIFAQTLLKILIATWVALYAVIMGFGVLVDSGPTDFNGNPNTLFDHVTNTSMLILYVLIVGLVGMLIRQMRISIFIAIIVAGALPWIINAVVYHDAAALAFPAVFAIGFGLLCAIYTCMIPSPVAVPAPKKHSKPKKLSTAKKPNL